MQILKPGRKQAGRSKKFTCTGNGNGGGGCGALLLVSEHDLYRTSSSHYDGSTDYYTTFCCPQCGCETDIKDYSANCLGTRPSDKERQERALANLKRDDL